MTTSHGEQWTMHGWWMLHSLIRLRKYVSYVGGFKGQRWLECGSAIEELAESVCILCKSPLEATCGRIKCSPHSHLTIVLLATLVIDPQQKAFYAFNTKRKSDAGSFQLAAEYEGPARQCRRPGAISLLPSLKSDEVPVNFTYLYDLNNELQRSPLSTSPSISFSSREAVSSFYILTIRLCRSRQRLQHEVFRHMLRSPMDR